MSMTREKAIAVLLSDRVIYQEWEEAVRIAVKALKEQRPRGEWILHTTIDGYTTHATCSSCGWNRKAGQYCSLNLDNMPKYCENCGSDNRKEGGGRQ